MDWRARSLAVLVSGALFFFGTGLTPIAGVAVLAPFPVLWLAPRIGAWPAAAIAFLAFVLGTTNSWVLYADSVDVPIPMAAMIVVGTAAVFTAVVVLFRALMRRGFWLLAVLSAPAVHVSGWYLASVLSPAGVLGTLATGQADVPVVLQIASLTGALGVDYLLMLVPAAAAALLTPGTARLRITAVTATAVLATLAFGTFRLATATDESHYRVAMIGGNARGQWATDVTSQAGQQKITGYVREIERTTADIVVLPEGAFAATDASLTTLVTPLTRLASEKHTTIVVGVVLNQRNNSAVAVSENKAPVVYHKWHDRGKKIVPGHDLRYLPNTDVGMVVCGDVNFANPFRDYGASGTDLIAIPASTEDVNGWQVSRTALLRGIENGAGTAWAAQRGTVFAADGWGRTVTSAQTDAPTVTTTADLPAGPGRTLYNRLGDWFTWLCLALTAFALVATTRKPTSPPIRVIDA